MINLLRVELHRIVVRRFLWGMLGLTVVVLAISGLIVFRDHADQDDVRLVAVIESEQRQQDQFEAECRQEVAKEDASLCDSPDIRPEDIYVNDDRLRPEDIWRPRRPGSFFATESALTVVDDSGEIDLAEDGDEGSLIGFLVVWGLIAGVLGAGFIGAEYKAGTIETALLWEPRRLRVLAAKYSAGALVAALGTVVVALGVFVVMAPTLAARGTTQGMDVDYWQGVLGAVGRGALMAALAALATMALATITRSTAGGIAVFFVGLGGSEILLRVLGSDQARFLPGSNGYAVITGADVTNDGVGFGPALSSHGTVGAVVLCLGCVAVLLAAAAALFNRRDVDA